MNAIGRSYRYPNHKKKFKLIEIINGFVYVFECGHRCTHNVFSDLIDCQTGTQNYKNNQLELFHE